MEELQLPPRRRGVAGEFELQVLDGFAEARAWLHGGPQARVVRADIPRGSAAHAEAAVENAIFVDGVLPFHGVESFEEIHFAGESAGVAETSVKMQHDGVARRPFSGIACAVGQKVDFAERFIAAVEPGIEDASGAAR